MWTTWRAKPKWVFSRSLKAVGPYATLVGEDLEAFVLGSGKPFFPGARPPLRLIGTERIGDDAVRLTYVPV